MENAASQHTSVNEKKEAKDNPQVSIITPVLRVSSLGKCNSLNSGWEQR